MVSAKSLNPYQTDTPTTTLALSKIAMAPNSESQAGEDAAMQDAPPSHQPVGEAEEAEGDQAVEDEAQEGDYEEEEEEPQRVRLVCSCGHQAVRSHTFEANGRQLAGSTATAASFEFADEGHTLGNALRYIIMKK